MSRLLLTDRFLWEYRDKNFNRVCHGLLTMRIGSQAIIVLSGGEKTATVT